MVLGTLGVQAVWRGAGERDAGPRRSRRGEVHAGGRLHCVVAAMRGRIRHTSFDLDARLKWHER